MQLSITPIEATDEIEVNVVFRIPAAGGKLTSFEQAEEALALRLNEIGSGATGHLLSACDSKGEALICDGSRWTSKGRAKRVVETPYGPYPMLCHVYVRAACAGVLPRAMLSSHCVRSTSLHHAGITSGLNITMQPQPPTNSHHSGDAAA